MCGNTTHRFHATMERSVRPFMAKCIDYFTRSWLRLFLNCLFETKYFNVKEYSGVKMIDYITDTSNRKLSNTGT